MHCTSTICGCPYSLDFTILFLLYLLLLEVLFFFLLWGAAGGGPAAPSAVRCKINGEKSVSDPDGVSFSMHSVVLGPLGLGRTLGIIWGFGSEALTDVKVRWRRGWVVDRRRNFPTRKLCPSLHREL